MRWKALVLATVVATLACAASAQAKGPLHAGDISLCGSSRCTPVDDGDTLQSIAAVAFGEGGGPGAGPASTPPPLQPYRELRWKQGDLLTSVVITPQAVLVGNGPSRYRTGAWHVLPERAAAVLRDLASGVPAFPAPRLRRVYLDARTAPEPAPYQALFELGQPVQAPSYKAARIHIGLTSARPNPWLGPSSYLDVEYVPAADTVAVPGGWVHVPPALATLIERDARGARPAVEVAPAHEGFPWAPVAAGLGAFVLAVSVALSIAAAHRRRTQAA